MVLEKVINGERPGRPSGANTMTNELWNLVNACWNHDRAARPKSGLVVDHLKHILRQSATDPYALPPMLPKVQSDTTSLATVGHFSLFSQTLTPHGAPTRKRPSEEEAALVRCLKRIRRHADPSRMYHELKLTYACIICSMSFIYQKPVALPAPPVAPHSRIMLRA